MADQTAQERAEALVPCMKSRFCPPRLTTQGAYGRHDMECPQQYVDPDEIAKAIREAEAAAYRRGQEAMKREAAAEAYECCSKRIAALPIEEEPTNG